MKNQKKKEKYKDLEIPFILNEIFEYLFYYGNLLFD
jgi:hypothetical protein